MCHPILTVQTLNLKRYTLDIGTNIISIVGIIVLRFSEQ